MVELKCETDFVAKSDQFNAVAKDLAQSVLAGGPDAASQRSGDLDELKITLKENIELGRVVQFVKGAGNVLDSYLHVQSERGVNGVLVETSGTSQEIAHDIAVHIAFARPKYLSRDEVPAADVEKERARPSRRSPATRASPSRPSRRSSRVVSTASSRTSACSTSRSRRTTRSRSAKCSVAVRSCGSRRSRSGPERRTVSDGTVSEVKPRWKRVVLKLSGEAFAEPSGYGIDGNVVEQVASEIVDVRNNLGVDIAVVVGGGNIWRGMRGAGSGMDRARVRLHGHARHAHQLPRAPRRARTPRAGDPRADRDRDGEGRGAVHPPARGPPPREGTSRDLRGRHRQPVLHDRHDGCAARRGDRGRSDPEGDPLRGRRRVHRGPEARPRPRRDSTTCRTSKC